MGFARFMAGPVGRGLRIGVGLALVIIGVAMESGVGWAIAVVGVLPIVAGAANVCVLGPLFGAPFSGRAALMPGRK